MLDHVSITVPDLRAAEAFYDAVMEALGVPKVGASAAWLGYGVRCDLHRPEGSYLSIILDPDASTAKGRHWAFKASSREQVDAFWRAGLAAGGRDAGGPGTRAHYHPAYYAAFLEDPGGNRIEAVCHVGS
jgi:catechol 2,3-dioxygenase-like lactoylglutathione lyase family enzyme